jgi:hypothetical protein
MRSRPRLYLRRLTTHGYEWRGTEGHRWPDAPRVRVKVAPSPAFLPEELSMLRRQLDRPEVQMQRMLQQMAYERLLRTRIMSCGRT